MFVARVADDDGAADGCCSAQIRNRTTSNTGKQAGAPPLSLTRRAKFSKLSLWNIILFTRK